MKRILVTGAKGLVGSALIASLRACEGIVVRAGVRGVTTAEKDWRCHSNVQSVSFDFTDSAITGSRWPN